MQLYTNVHRILQLKFRDLNRAACTIAACIPYHIEIHQGATIRIHVVPIDVRITGIQSRKKNHVPFDGFGIDAPPSFDAPPRHRLPPATPPPPPAPAPSPPSPPPRRTQPTEVWGGGLCCAVPAALSICRLSGLLCFSSLRGYCGARIRSEPCELPCRPTPTPACVDTCEGRRRDGFAQGCSVVSNCGPGTAAGRSP